MKGRLNILRGKIEDLKLLGVDFDYFISNGMCPVCNSDLFANNKRYCKECKVMWVNCCDKCREVKK